MAQRIIRPPGVTDNKNFRARETYDKAIEDQLRMVGESVSDVGSIAAGGVATVTITVPGARADMGMTVQLGLPAAWTVGLMVYGYVSADGVVTVVIYNSTGAPINPPSFTYSARVMP